MTTKTRSPLEDLAIGALLVFAAASACTWATAAAIGLLLGARVPSFTDAAVALTRLPHTIGDPGHAWPHPFSAGPVTYWITQVVVIGAVAASVAAIVEWRRRPKGRRGSLGMAVGVGVGRGPHLRSLAVAEPTAGRVTIGTVGRRLVAAEPGVSALVVGPTGCGKTAGFAIPNLREWRGPVIATSVKTDLLAATIDARRAIGRVWVYDPANITAHDDGWSPLATCRTWAGAQRVAAWLTDAAQPATTTLADGDYWYAQARRALAPYLFAAALASEPVGTVVRWVDTHPTEALQILSDHKAQDALRVLHGLWGKDERLVASITSTVETVLAGYADPHVAALAEHSTINLDEWLAGPNTIYVVSAAHDQARLRPVLAVLVADAIRTAFDTANRSSGTLDQPLLALLDEAGTMAPLAELPTWAATARSHGISLVTVWQDLAQIKSRYGALAATVVNNHRAKLFGSGIADRDTLDTLAALIGDEEDRDTTTTSHSDGGRTINETLGWRRAAPPDTLRRIAPHEALLLYGHHLPARVRLRPSPGRQQ
ncbi:MAG TPA: type IV secretory system conjugative DNA transfer family protein [Acidimicrobiales bacterium]|jgi:type IV secretion system protein VirD4|nr:type IV secretory system conjugative DNA transfer family protein [Acidimicrobiales bacterium]